MAVLRCGGHLYSRRLRRTSTTTLMQGTAADEAAVRTLSDRYVAAYNAGDATGIAALMADDYQAVAADGTVVNGKAGVQEMVGVEMQMNEKLTGRY